MSFQLNLAPSQVVKLAKETAAAGEDGEEGEEPQRKRREDYKKLKDLEEARKAGTAPAMKDEEGRDINPHIPQYIMQAPWYYNADQATLRHQRMQPEDVKTYAKMGEWYKRGAKEGGTVATKFRKGACENCGAMTHAKKDCLERPRKRLAKYSNSNFAPDEHIQPNLDLDFEGKRDRWNGYDLEAHKQVQEEHRKIEEAKKLLKSQKFDKDVDGASGSQVDDDEDDDDDKYAEDVIMPGQKFETKQRITVRNLRIREDTAKYLHNLNTNSAHYDPKTRSMRNNPFEGSGKTMSNIPYAGDNFVRYSGDANEMSKQQLFAWEAYEKGGDVHLQADPTKLEILAREVSKRKEGVKSKDKDSILEKYGGQEYLEAPPKQMLMAQTEDYVEYSRTGQIVKGAEKEKVKSSYEEDIYLNNHSSVWGSYWHDGQWGFGCCHSLIKESYCTGEAGKEASVPISLTTASTSTQQTQQQKAPEETLAIEAAAPKESSPSESEEEEEEAPVKKSKKKKNKKDKKKKKKSKKSKKSRKRKHSSSSDDSSSEDEDEAREKRIRIAMEVEKERVAEVNRLMKLDERKRPYNSMSAMAEPTEEDMEAFRRKQVHPDDPMAKFL